MSRPLLEVADIFRDHGPAWRRANAGHVSLGQLKVMSAIESCRTAASRPASKATAMRSIRCPAFFASSRQRLSSFSKAFSSDLELL
jgi:hypothetical protein